MILVQKLNVILEVPDEALDRYLADGFEVIRDDSSEPETEGKKKGR